MRLALKKLPRGSQALERAYSGALERIENQQNGFKGLAKRVLTWITYGVRPFTATELQHALAIEVGSAELDFENFTSSETMADVCAGLVMVDQKSNIIRLVHYTAQEYFEQIRAEWLPTGSIEISQACLTYLTFQTLACGGSCKFDGELEKDHEFFQYASTAWGFHALQAGEIVTAGLAKTLLLNQELVNRSVRILQRMERYPLAFSGLHLAAYFGLEGTIKAVFPTTESLKEIPDAIGRTPLSWAAEKGHVSVVQLMLTFPEIKINSRDRSGRTPLSWSAQSGCAKVVELLLRADGINVNLADSNGWGPLSWAAQCGQCEVAKLLLAAPDIQANLMDKVFGQTPLALAVLHGQVGMIELLLNSENVDPDSKDDNGRTPLWLAAAKGDIESVNIFLYTSDVYPDFESRDRFGESVLEAAVRNRHDEIADSLAIASGVDLSSIRSKWTMMRQRTVGSTIRRR